MNCLSSLVFILSPFQATEARVTRAFAVFAQKVQIAPVVSRKPACYNSIGRIEACALELSMRKNRLFVILLSVILLLSCMPAAAAKPEASSFHDFWQREQPLTDTVTLTESVFDNGYRQAEHYITVSPGGSIRPRLVFGDTLCERFDVEEVSSRSEERVLAAVNGDYFVLGTGMPIGIVVRDGELLSSCDGNYAFGFYEDGAGFLGRPELSMRFSSGEYSYPLSGINKAYRNGQFCLYSSVWGTAVPTVGETITAVLVPMDGQPLHVGGKARFRVESVNRSDVRQPLEKGKYALCLSADSDPWLMAGMEALQAGSELTLEIRAEDERFEGCFTALGCLYPLVVDREAADGLETADRSMAPRTAVGLKEDGTLLLYTVDGRQEDHSRGLTLAELAERLLELGCAWAGTLDGGASTVLSAQLPGEDGCSIRNRPSLGEPRECPQYLTLSAPKWTASELCTIAVCCSECVLLCGSSAALTLGGCDSCGIPVPVRNPFWRTDIGTVDENGVFTAPDKPGAAEIRVTAGEVTGMLSIPVVDKPDSLTICLSENGTEPEVLRVLPGAVTALEVRALWNTVPVSFDDTQCAWSVKGQIGAVSSDGVFTAGTQPAAGRIHVSVGGAERELMVVVSGGVICADGFEDSASGCTEHLQWQRETLRDRVKYGMGSLRLDYDLEDGTAYFPMDGYGTELMEHTRFWLFCDGSYNSITAVHENARILLGHLDFRGWVPFTAETGRYGALKALEISGSGRGTLWMDQLLLSSEKEADVEAPVIRMNVSETTLTADIWDRQEEILGVERLRLTVDGADHPFVYDPDTGVLSAALPENSEASHVMLFAEDNSGNYNSASVLTGSVGAPFFPDVKDHWAQPYVDYLCSQGVLNGMRDADGNPCFQPNRSITRAEFAVMLCRWMGLGNESDDKTVFADEGSIPAWAVDSVHAAAAAGLIRGSETESGICFLPSESLTRAQAAAILGRSMAGGRMSADLPFPDASEIPSWAVSYISELCFMGVMRGDGTRLDPGGDLTRAQAAKLLTELT